ncbi:MAG: 50S ribosomal protein L29 [Nitrospirae bacterium CG18_big_fil_WC_8_21_14_2_50_70_55]|nr:50S ribosomal protein L29 [Deltaproteobacteria bacterium]OIP67005.1 MAG: 50S ribosomal protein L29 [Nitrospirae bacterium CG2_30_70_394]PIQ07270.1 MAG: 50S ribosomal protein L29 [Nitrospirae bacterium CG18_big_fil_WC_8_21_14_2_50_70_55]PIU80135.1 MAG: 50S ribosomal protein L29 [Nitrospirae bacterium CG06_land_8_20_14_3_00_70_43]PIW82690.1 MAG: 50S ribosomal protein L29 [Nitrospirae bacterium CG_4_8_14_3_um_filter_70_85]PIX84031.1 MAG: 50S ribosomal protein L29 [Nitrospirae bacterium CG_4_10
MTAAELRRLSIEDLEKRIEEGKREMLDLRFQGVSGRLGNPMVIRKLRGDIARMKTVHNEMRGSLVPVKG